jgi:hypothetical protein
MSKAQGLWHWISVIVFISILLFKGVAFAAMWCCGAAGSEHATHHPSTLVAVQMPDHVHHMEMQQAKSEQQDQNACPGCASDCTAAALMINPVHRFCESTPTEPIQEFTAFQLSQTHSALERPPRFIN